MRKGFTLIELLSVVILIAILIVVSVTAINYLTKKREGDILSLKLKTFHSSVGDYMDKNSNAFKNKEKYVYCVDINQFMSQSKYKEKDFSDMYEISDIANYVIKISFENPSNFDINVVEMANCTSGIRKDNISLIGKFGTEGYDEILDVKSYGDKYVVLATAYYGAQAAKIESNTPSFMANTKKGTVKPMSATNYDKEFYVSLVDKDLNILKIQKLPFLNEALLDVTKGINVLLNKDYSTKLIKMDDQLNIIDESLVEIPSSTAHAEKMIFHSGFYYVTFKFDQRERKDREVLSDGYDKMIAKINQTGNVIWSKVIGSNGGEYWASYNLNVDSAGYVFYSFNSTSNTGDLTDSPFSSNFTTFIKINSDGNIIWKKYFNSDLSSYNNTKKFSNIVENRGYIYATNKNNTNVFLNKISSTDGTSTNLFTFDKGTIVKKMIFYQNELYFLVATSSNTGIFAGLNPESDWNNYIVRATKDGAIVKRIVAPDEYISSENLIFDNNGILITFSNYTDKEEVHVIRINEKTLEFEQEKVFYIGDSYSSDILSFGKESLLFFDSRENLHDLSKYEISGANDIFFARISW